MDQRPLVITSPNIRVDPDAEFALLQRSEIRDWTFAQLVAFHASTRARRDSLAALAVEDEPVRLNTVLVLRGSSNCVAVGLIGDPVNRMDAVLDGGEVGLADLSALFTLASDRQSAADDTDAWLGRAALGVGELTVASRPEPFIAAVQGAMNEADLLRFSDPADLDVARDATTIVNRALVNPVLELVRLAKIGNPSASGATLIESFTSRTRDDARAAAHGLPEAFDRWAQSWLTEHSRLSTHATIHVSTVWATTGVLPPLPRYVNGSFV